MFKDIGVPGAEDHLVKAQLAFKIDTLMKERRLKQVEAAALFGIRQPAVSKRLRGEFRQFSVSAFCASSSRSIRMSQSSSNLTGIETRILHSMSPERT